MSHTFLPSITMRTNSGAGFSDYYLMLPFILPQNLIASVQQRVVAPDGITYQLPYKLGDLNAPNITYQSKIYIKGGTPVTFNIPDTVDLTKFTFLLLDTSCSGKYNEYRITFSQIS
jgi:hypothetical protein